MLGSAKLAEILENYFRKGVPVLRVVASLAVADSPWFFPGLGSYFFSRH